MYEQEEELARYHKHKTTRPYHTQAGAQTQPRVFLGHYTLLRIAYLNT